MGGNNLIAGARSRKLISLGAVALTVSLWTAKPAGQPPVPYFHTSDRCVACHNGLFTNSGEDISIGLDWSSTIMANSSRDPYWQAAVRRETIDHPESRAAIEDECSICHMPMARFESKLAGHEGTVFSHLGFVPGNQLDTLAADGVSCSICHQISKEKLGTRESFVGNFVIGGPNVQGERVEYGPYAPDRAHVTIMRSSTGGFVPTESAHIRQSELCATCHTLITKALGPDGKVIAELPEQVPYQEWLHSDYKGARSCQSCHMPLVPEEVAISSVVGVPRAGVSRHQFLGGNFFMQNMLNRFRSELNVTALPQNLSAAAERTIAHLQSQSSRLSLSEPQVRDGRLETEVTIENLGGHKLPTAYPSRRVWLHVMVRDRNNRIVFESGAMDSTGAVKGNDNDESPARFEPHYAEIREPGQVQIYESIMVGADGGVTTGLLTGVRYVKDNRLLPLGFDKRTAESDIAVQGPALEDADFVGGGDAVRYSIDVGNSEGPFQVEAELCYQPIGYRWASNLKPYNAEEPQRFTRYYDALSSSSMTVLTRSRAQSR